jgi:hypothetical protein
MRPPIRLHQYLGEGTLVLVKPTELFHFEPGARRPLPLMVVWTLRLWLLWP